MACEKTKIPLPSSKLPPLKSHTQMATTMKRKVLGTLPCNELKPSFRRRSKSVTDLTAMRKYKPLDDFKKKPLSKAINETIAPKKLRRSMSVPNINNKAALTTVKEKPADLKKKVLIKPLKPIPVVQQKKPVKRPADTKPADEIKAKVSKPARIPPYDYKARFNALTEKHTNLQTLYKETKEKLTAIESLKGSYQELLNKHNKLQVELEIVKEENNKNVSKLDNLTKELNTYKKNYDHVTSEHKKLKSEQEKLSKDYEEAIKENLDLKPKLKDATAKIEQLEDTVDSYKTDLRKYGEIIRGLHNTIQDLKGKIRVICRIRPPTTNEEEGPLCNVNFIDEKTIEIRKNKESQSKLEFNFDKVFGPESSQKEVFEDLSHLVQSALDGYHVCVFAYGQTGSGKTYTMQGGECESDQGMIPQAVELIFRSVNDLKRQGWSYTIQASFLEIYNETIKDLLDPKSKESLDIQHNDGRSIGVKNLAILDVNTAEDLMELMNFANKNRAVAATNFNEHSSRSHAVTKIYIQGVQDDNLTVLNGSINLVDLAGSESAKTSERMTETKSINKSLSTLGQVMLALHNKDQHIPYRNSKLTHLLQNCLGGNSKTLMFVNVSPLEDCYSESVNSLRFASKVKQVKINARKNKTYSKMDASTGSLKG